MKKIFSIIAAVLFAGSMFAADATITLGEKAYAATVNGVKGVKCGTGNADGNMTLTVGAGATKLSFNAVAWKGAAGDINISAEGITVSASKIELEANDAISGASNDFTISGDLSAYAFELTLSGVNAATAIKFASGTARRFVVWGATHNGEAGEGGDPVVADTITCAKAAELALAGNTSEQIIKGYVTEIVDAWSSYKNVSFWMADAKDGGQVFEAYRVKCETAAEAPTVGALVWVKGNLTKYTKNEKTIPETAQGGTFGILVAGEVVEPAKNLGEKTIAEFLELKNEKDTCVLTGLVSNIQNTTYGNFDLVDEENDQISVYIYGLLNAAGEAMKFEELGIEEGDILTLKAIYSEYNNAPQVKNGIYVSHVPGGDPETAIDNTAAEVKAQKVVRDGQLLIIRNGVVFNANGTTVK